MEIDTNVTFAVNDSYVIAWDNTDDNCDDEDELLMNMASMNIGE